MSKRPPSQLGEQPTTKRINIDQQDQYEKANAKIHSVIQPLLGSQMPRDVIWVVALSMIPLFAPSALCLKPAMTSPLYEELITANPELKKALERAIEQGCYEDVMLLCRYL